jgi:hypothetical protein
MMNPLHPKMAHVRKSESGELLLWNVAQSSHFLGMSVGKKENTLAAIAAERVDHRLVKNRPLGLCLAPMLDSPADRTTRRRAK